GFGVELAGGPAKLRRPAEVTLDVTGRYYFDRPVAGGTVRARLTQADRWRGLAEAEGTLDDKGAARLRLRLPGDLDAGRYQVVCTVTDDSGRAVSSASPLEVVGPASAAPGLASVPRFVPAGEAFDVRTAAAEIVAEQAKTTLRFRAAKGAATLNLPSPGWYRLSAGAQAVGVFAYGGSDHPLALPR